MSSAVSLSEATVEAGQLFPTYLANTGRGCDYPAISNPPILDEFSSEWYSGQLLAANERPLTELAAADPQQLHVRFVWLRSFDQPIIVRSGLATEQAANCDMGLDGAQWILEVVADGHYSFFERWSPNEGPVRDVAFKMLTLTGFDLDPVY